MFKIIILKKKKSFELRLHETYSYMDNTYKHELFHSISFNL